MLDNPGSKALNEKLLEIIRLQRHYGVRLIVSTQEPTLMSDLIALSSVTIMHRFTSPEWLAALGKNIVIAKEEKQTLLQKIEGLKTGTALVYAPSAVLGRNEDATLVKGAGRLLTVKIRKRVTSDGGQSKLSVV